MSSLSPACVLQSVCSVFQSRKLRLLSDGSFLYRLALTVVWETDASLFVADANEKINIVDPEKLLSLLIWNSWFISMARVMRWLMFWLQPLHLAQQHWPFWARELRPRETCLEAGLLVGGRLCCSAPVPSARSSARGVHVTRGALTGDPDKAPVCFLWAKQQESSSANELKGARCSN